MAETSRTAAQSRGIGRVLTHTLAAHRGMAGLTLAVIALAVGAALFPPLVLERAINLLVSGRPIPLGMALLYFGLLALSGVMETGQSVVITVLGQKMTHSLRSAMCRKLGRLPAGYFTQNEAGVITARFVSDVDAVDSLFTGGIVSMVADGCKVLSILAVIFYKSTGLGVLLLIITPLLMVMTRVFQKRMLAAQLQNRAAVAKVSNHIPETIRNIRTIQTLFRHRYMEEKYDRAIEESYRATDRSNLYDALYSPIVVFLSAAVVAVLMVGAAMGGEAARLFGVTVGTAVAITAYVGKVFDPLENIGMEIQNIQSAVAGVRRIDDFLRERERPLPDPTAPAPDPAKGVAFDRVAFGYGPGEQVLRDLSFEAHQGEAVTLVGRTGAGKSTVFRLLLGLYTPDEGRVLVGGVEAVAIPDRAKRRLFGYVEQSFRLVAGTVAEQISLFDPAITRAQVEEAARLVGLHETILSLPQGYETPGERAAFSQGQLQLLSIARAVAAAPQVLLLDEITANLDSDTERRVLEALERASAGRTVLSISHRLREQLRHQRTLSIGG